MSMRRILGLGAMLAFAAAAGGLQAQAGGPGTGPHPDLPPPDVSWIPTVEVGEAVGWQAGEAPVAAPGFMVNAFARNLAHPRWLYVLPNGDVLVAETAAPPTPEEYEDGGLRAWFVGRFMKKAGAAVASADRITLLRDRDGDGQAEVQETFVDGLYSPFGMALVGDRFFVANADAVVEFAYVADATHLDGPPRHLAALPAGRNHHWTKSLVAAADGRTLYVGVGSNSNIGENGMAEEQQRAAILAIDTTTGASRVFASGLRNPVGLDWNPATGELWTAVNERDELGDDLVPDYMTSVRQGDFFGWPWSYFGAHADPRVEQRPDLVATARVPDYALGAHTASLGLAFYTGRRFAERYQGGAFVGQHGSWNRRPPAGYRVVFVPFSGGRPSGDVEPVLTGFLDEEEGVAHGRPVGVAVAADGALLIADDVGNVVWRVSPTVGHAPAARR